MNKNKIDKVENNIKNRDVNFELLRVILMLMIIILHFNIHGQVLNNLKLGSLNYYIIYFLEFASIVAVNLFVMITGYYMINSNIKYKKIIKLYAQILFYSVGLYVVSVVFFDLDFSKKMLLKTFFPITINRYWFMTAYLGLYLLIPFLNKMIKNLTKKEYTSMLVILFVLLSVIKTIYPSNSIFDSTHGYSLIWMLFLYVLGGYINTYLREIKVNKYFLLIGYLVMCLINLAVLDVSKRLKLDMYFNHRLAYNSVITVFETIFLFLYIMKCKFKNTMFKKIILKISPLTLGVYLIHDNPQIRKILWLNIIKPFEYVNMNNIYIVMLYSVISIFIISCIIEYIRIFIFDVIIKLYKKIHGKYILRNKDIKNLEQ